MPSTWSADAPVAGRCLGWPPRKWWVNRKIPFVLLWSHTELTQRGLLRGVPKPSSNSVVAWLHNIIKQQTTEVVWSCFLLLQNDRFVYFNLLPLFTSQHNCRLLFRNLWLVELFECNGGIMLTAYTLDNRWGLNQASSLFTVLCEWHLQQSRWILQVATTTNLELLISAPLNCDSLLDTERATIDNELIFVFPHSNLSFIDLDLFNERFRCFLFFSYKRVYLWHTLPT
jgi:hypothetical protein